MIKINRKGTELALIAAVAMVVVGCGGSNSGNGTPNGSTPAMPAAGNYQAVYQNGGPEKVANGKSAIAVESTGTVFITAASNGALTIGAAVNGGPGSFVGTGMVNPNDTFSATLTNSANAQTATISGTTYANSISLTMTGQVTTTTVMANYLAINNPMAGTYNGTITGGIVGASQPITFTVTNASTNNVSGTIVTASNGTIGLTGMVTPTGAFTASAPIGSSGDVLTLTGVFTLNSSGALQLGGLYVGLAGGADAGSWSANFVGNSGKARR